MGVFGEHLMNRAERAKLGREADAIVAAGRYSYVGVGGRSGVVDIGDAIETARRGTHLHEPDDPLLADAGGAPATDGKTAIEVTGETTLAAARRLVGEGLGSVACLNFASAKNPRGGYLGGARAQEETLARASALVTCLRQSAGYYEAHRQQRHPLYSDRLICSPDVPVFRGADGRLLVEPYAVNFLTCAAPNAGALAKRRDWDGDLAPVLRRRARRVLVAAGRHGWRRLVLGAWGCGVFGNDPHMVARAFAALLHGELARRFEHVTFAVFDPHPEAPNRCAFESVLSAP